MFIKCYRKVVFIITTVRKKDELHFVFGLYPLCTGKVGRSRRLRGECVFI